MDKELLEAGYRAYTGEKIDVYFNTAICQHSGNCVRGSAKLFNLKRKPWIIPVSYTHLTLPPVRGGAGDPDGAATRRIREGGR